MKKTITQEIIPSLILIVLVLSFVDPLHIWMPSHTEMLSLFVLVIVYIIYAVFMWRESAKDERENLHRLMASRNAWLAGNTVLVVAIVVQSIDYTIDPWLLFALVSSVLAKSITRIYGSIKN